MKRTALFQFTSFADWVNNAKSRFYQYRVTAATTDCIDAKGRHVYMGGDMERARDDGGFPVSVYRKKSQALTAKVIHGRR